MVEMMPDVDKDRKRLAQQDFLDFISRAFHPSDLITVWWDEQRPGSDGGVFCGLIPNAKLDQVLNRLEAEIDMEGGLPGTIKYFDRDNKPAVRYLRFGNDEGFEPLVIWRQFHGLREAYLEVSEEFRLFHRLYHDRTDNRCVRFNDAGDEEDVVIVEPNRVRVRLKEIRQFLAIKEMHLAIYFDCREHSHLTLEELGLTESSEDSQAGLIAYSLAYGDFGSVLEWRAYSRLLGKRLIPPFPKEKSGLWGFAKEEEKTFVDFVISLDEHGGEILHTSDPDLLSNNFGANPGHPNYLTAVFFKKAVLDKYFEHPSRYSVEDGYLWCGSLWGISIDNHHDDQVVAWLGDLGRDLPYEEQLHWRSFNTAPRSTVSQVFFNRQIDAIPTDTDQPELKFKQRYSEFCEKCMAQLGWPLFLPLSAKDERAYQSFRLPASDEQKEFDDLVLILTKLIVDSLNEAKLTTFIPVSERSGVKGSISRLERAMACYQVAEYDTWIKFLRNLQDLRSTGSAHRKGDAYDQAARRFGSDTSRLPKVFRGILVQAIALIDFLEAAIDSGAFAISPADS